MIVGNKTDEKKPYFSRPFGLWTIYLKVVLSIDLFGSRPGIDFVTTSFSNFINWINRYRDSYPLVMRKRGYICLYWPEMAKIA